MITIRCRCWLRAARRGACRAGAISACPKARRSRTCSSRCSTRSTCRSSRSPTARGSSRSDMARARDRASGESRSVASPAIERRGMTSVANRPRTALAAVVALSLAVAAIPSAFAQPRMMRGGDAVAPIPLAPAPDDVPASPLAEAARRGDVDEVLALLALGGVDVDAPSRDGSPALHWLLRLGEHEVVRQLIAAGADVNKANRYGLKPLHVAIEAGDAALVRLLLEAGADPSAPDRASEPPLMLAARVGEPAVIEVLLEHGAEVDAREPHYGQTPLMIAVREGHLEVVEVLLAAGADVNAQTFYEDPPRFIPPSESPDGLSKGVGIIR